MGIGNSQQRQKSQGKAGMSKNSSGKNLHTLENYVTTQSKLLGDTQNY